MLRVTLRRARALRHLNFLITDTFAEAEAQCAAALDAGKRPFVMTIKDNYAVKGIRMTCASRMLKDFVPTYTATCVQRLLDNGGCLLGKGNMDEFGMGSTTSTGYFGPTLNASYVDEPDAHARADYRVAGGSSGGCAVSVAAGVADVALGSDTGGSVRYPAALNGVYGFKPSYGRLSRHGLVPLANALDTPSIFARSARDCKHYFDIMKGHDPMDSTSLPDDVVANSTHFDKSARSASDLIIGIPAYHRLDLLSPDSRRVWYAACAQLQAKGARTCEVPLPHCEHGIHCYAVVVDMEVASNMARYDGIRFGHNDAADGDSYIAQITASRTETLGQNVKRRIFSGNFFGLEENYTQYVEQAARVRRLIAHDFDAAFRLCDVLLTPVARHSAPLMSELDGRSRVDQRLDDYFVSPANLCGVPAICIPFAHCAKGLPLGVQLIAPYLADDFLLQVAEMLTPLSPSEEHHRSIHSTFDTTHCY